MTMRKTYAMIEKREGLYWALFFSAYLILAWLIS